jgi:hypothetical protein
MIAKSWILAGVSAVTLLIAVNPAFSQRPVKRIGKTLRPPIGGRYYSRDPMLHSVVRYAVGHLGKKVEFEKRPPGENPHQCTDLVNAALNYAGAKENEKRQASAHEIKRGWASDANEVYDWGQEVKPLPARLYTPYAGQIIQFERCVFEKPDGSRSFTMQHHTAIVGSADGYTVTLLHQNAGGDGSVRLDTLDLNWLKSGHFRVYRPEPR